MEKEKNCVVCGQEKEDALIMHDIYDHEHHVCTGCFVQGLRFINEVNRESTLFVIEEFEKVSGQLLREINMQKEHKQESEDSNSLYV